MRRRLLRLRSLCLALAAFAVLPLVPAPARAQQMVLELDPAKTRLEFTLDAFLHTVHGTSVKDTVNLTFRAAGTLSAAAPQP